MNVKSSAHYQREYRKRLREQGLVKREIWILPEHTERSRSLEKELRIANIEPSFAGLTRTPARGAWSTAALFGEMHNSQLVQGGQATLELIEGADPTLLVLMKQFGDLPVFVNAAGEQIIVESVLWRAADVSDIPAFNEAVLRTHKLFPLSTICLDLRAGEDYYLMFGSVGSSVSLASIELEINTLASNVLYAAEAYREYLISDSEENS